MGRSRGMTEADLAVACAFAIAFAIVAGVARSSGRRRGRIPAVAETTTGPSSNTGDRRGFNSFMGKPVFVRRMATGAGPSIRFGLCGGRKLGRPANTRCPSGDKVPSDEGATKPRSSNINTAPSGAGDGGERKN